MPRHAPQRPTDRPPCPTWRKDVTVHLRSRIVAVGRWESRRWELLAIDADPDAAPHEDCGDVITCTVPLQLYGDAVRAYRYNLESPTPKLFLVATGEDARRPLLATLSQDEAASYMEAEQEVLSHPLPDALCRWAAAYVDARPACETGGDGE